MKPELIFLPLIAQILLVIWLYFRLAIVKNQALDAGLVDEEKRALDESAWPPSVRKVNNNIRNQFEAPVLFYMVALIIYQLDAVSPGIVIACCAFVISRFFHSVVHTGSNIVATRKKLFTLGILILIGLSIYTLGAIVLTPSA